MVARNPEQSPYSATNITVIAPNKHVAENVAREHEIKGEPRWRWRDVRSLGKDGIPRKSNWYTITDGDIDEPNSAA